MSDMDDAPTPEEIEEARLLAEALERRRSGVDAPEDALGAASFLRFSAGGTALRAEDSDVLVDRALAEARAPATQPRGLLASLRWRPLAGLLALGLAAAGAVVLTLPPRATELPAPSLALLEAQAAVAAGADPLRLDHEMRGYREQMRVALEGRYRR